MCCLQMKWVSYKWHNLLILALFSFLPGFVSMRSSVDSVPGFEVGRCCRGLKLWHTSPLLGEKKEETFLQTINMELVFSNVAGSGLHAQAWLLPSGLEAR